MHSSQLPIWIDTDNALGSPFGDIDDAYAIAALARSQAKILGISSVFGNSFEPQVHRNNLELSQFVDFRGPVVRGCSTWWSKKSTASKHLSDIQSPFRLLSIGPLTNLDRALTLKPALSETLHETVLVGTNLGFTLPATRLTDFNLWKDPFAAWRVFNSKLNLTVVPCDVARRLRFTVEDVKKIPGKLGGYLTQGSRRWFLRARLLKRIQTIPVWDLTAAMYMIDPEAYCKETQCLKIGLIRGVGWKKLDPHSLENRKFPVITSFDVNRVKKRFFDLFETDAATT